ncbi:MAG: 2-nitropropane dioxygenase [Acidimicrobiaceae bacterium]|jgi:NAD(P)H-dependent flavin oxidoreductase YrpB (nitropropane dioxygenase family)|nr:2-nitropropane dioxygenase [Acidimicrobiaceae bacterium]|tara:strand:+ start:23482 stop:24555 length:1074 start_codon:yes stop_codon:yes gene_type:complete
MSEYHRKLKTPFCKKLGIDYPIIQTGMGWVSTAKLTAATSSAGAIGFLATATQTFEEMKKAVWEIKENTDKPFGINVRTDSPDIDDRLSWAIQEGVKVVSFAQAPNPDMVKKLSDSGVITIPTIAARRHAEKVAEWGVDAVIAQGQEGGGHTGEVPTAVLVPQVTKAIDIPVFAAGGITDGRGLVASLAWGAQGIAMGTRFLLSQESEVPQAVKQAYFNADVTDTVRTRSVDGVPQRVINSQMVKSLERNRIIKFPTALKNALKFRHATEASVSDLLTEALSMKKNQDMTWAQVSLAANAPMLTKATMVDGNTEIGIMPTGIGLGVIASAPSVLDIIHGIMAEASECLNALTDNKAL